MKAVTIRANGGVWITCEDGLSVNALGISVIGMAGRTFLDHPDLIPLPGRNLVNVRMAILTLHLVDEMDTGVMFHTLFSMTPVAGDWLAMDFRPFCFQMVF